MRMGRSVLQPKIAAVNQGSSRPLATLRFRLGRVWRSLGGGGRHLDECVMARQAIELVRDIQELLPNFRMLRGCSQGSAFRGFVSQLCGVRTHLRSITKLPAYTVTSPNSFAQTRFFSCGVTVTSPVGSGGTGSTPKPTFEVHRPCRRETRDLAAIRGSRQSRVRPRPIPHSAPPGEADPCGSDALRSRSSRPCARILACSRRVSGSSIGCPRSLPRGRQI